MTTGIFEIDDDFRKDVQEPASDDEFEILDEASCSRWIFL